MLGASYSVSIYNIYLGAFSNQTMNLMDFLGSHIGSSYWYNILTNYYYYDPWSEERLYVTNVTSFAGRTNLLSDAKGLILTEDDIVTLLYTAMTDPYSDLIVDSGAVYEIMFRGDFNVSFNGGFWLKDWCSFHASFELPTGDVIKVPSNRPSLRTYLSYPLPFICRLVHRHGRPIHRNLFFLSDQLRAVPQLRQRKQQHEHHQYCSNAQQ